MLPVFGSQQQLFIIAGERNTFFQTFLATFGDRATDGSLDHHALCFI